MNCVQERILFVGLASFKSVKPAFATKGLVVTEGHRHLHNTSSAVAVYTGFLSWFGPWLLIYFFKKAKLVFQCCLLSFTFAP